MGPLRTSSLIAFPPCCSSQTLPLLCVPFSKGDASALGAVLSAQVSKPELSQCSDPTQSSWTRQSRAAPPSPKAIFCLSWWMALICSLPSLPPCSPHGSFSRSKALSPFTAVMLWSGQCLRQALSFHPLPCHPLLHCLPPNTHCVPCSPLGLESWAQASALPEVGLLLDWGWGEHQIARGARQVLWWGERPPQAKARLTPRMSTGVWEGVGTVAAGGTAFLLSPPDFFIC